MKCKLLPIFFILCYLCSFIAPSLAQSYDMEDNPTWRSSINIKSQQITINGQDNLLTLNLFMFSKRQAILQIIYEENDNTPKNVSYLNFTLGKDIFTLKKQVIKTRNQAIFDTTLNKQQVQFILQSFKTQKNAYIARNNDVIAFSLKSSDSIVSSLVQYLNIHPIPELYVYFEGLSPSHSSYWFHISLQQNMLIFIMAFIVFLLLCGRPIFKFIRYIYNKRINSYRTNKALKITIQLIEQNANILYIKRDQLLYKDEYGSLIEDKWIQEVYRFIRTKIKPILAEKHLSEYYPYIQKLTFKKILSIAKQPPSSKKIFFQKSQKLKLQYSRTMNPYDYEIYCAELLKVKGWDANVTSASGDQGADIIAIKNGITLIIQCKLYSKPVGNKAVQEANAAKFFYHAHFAAVVSNAAYTTSARQLASSTKVTLLHHETLQKFVQTLI